MRREPFDLADRHRASEEEALAVRDAQRLQDTQLLARLDAFGDDLRVHLSSEAHQRLEEILLDLPAVDPAHEDVVELQVIGLDVRERGQVRVAGADVVDGDAKVLRAEFREDFAEEPLVDGVRALGDLQDDAIGLEAQRHYLVAEERSEELGVRSRRWRKVQKDLAAVVALGRRLERALPADALQRNQKLRPLGQREERLAAFELAPPWAPRQGLHADHVPGREIEHRLEDRGDVTPRDRVLEELPSADFLSHGLARYLVARLLDSAVDHALETVLGILHDRS